jgi:hypothetical protein
VSRGQRDRSLRLYSRILRPEQLLFLSVAPQLYSWGWVDPITERHLLRKSCSAGNRTRTSGSLSRNSDYRINVWAEYMKARSITSLKHMGSLRLLKCANPWDDWKVWDPWDYWNMWDPWDYWNMWDPWDYRRYTIPVNTETYGIREINETYRIPEIIEGIGYLWVLKHGIREISETYRLPEIIESIGYLWILKHMGSVTLMKHVGSLRL